MDILKKIKKKNKQEMLVWKSMPLDFWQGSNNIKPSFLPIPQQIRILRRVDMLLEILV